MYAIIKTKDYDAMLIGLTSDMSDAKRIMTNSMSVLKDTMTEAEYSDWINSVMGSVPGSISSVRGATETHAWCHKGGVYEWKIQNIVLSNSNTHDITNGILYLRHTAADIVDVFAGFLEDHNIDIPNPEKEGEDGESIIYGSDFSELEGEILDVLVSILDKVRKTEGYETEYNPIGEPFGGTSYKPLYDPFEK